MSLATSAFMIALSAINPAIGVLGGLINFIVDERATVGRLAVGTMMAGLDLGELAGEMLVPDVVGDGEAIVREAVGVIAPGAVELCISSLRGPNRSGVVVNHHGKQETVDSIRRIGRNAGLDKDSIATAVRIAEGSRISVVNGRFVSKRKPLVVQQVRVRVDGGWARSGRDGWIEGGWI